MRTKLSPKIISGGAMVRREVSASIGPALRIGALWVVMVRGIEGGWKVRGGGCEDVGGMAGRGGSGYVLEGGGRAVVVGCDEGAGREVIA